VVRRRKPNADAYLDALVEDRRPPRFPAEDDAEAGAMLAAAGLRAGRPGADSPHPQFVENLERRLRGAMEQPGAAGAARVSRRRLLGGAAAAAAAAVGAGVGIDRLVDRGGDGGAGATAELVPKTGRWVDVAAVDAVPVGRPMRFSAGAVEVFVVNHGDGRMQAVSAMCTHLPCTLVFNANAQRLDCPCHDAWFGLDGKPVGSSYPYTLPSLPTVRTRVLDGRVQVFSA
jgi:nitrite reductase/ring-hydroxylating ferredoxin subunit